MTTPNVAFRRAEERAASLGTPPRPGETATSSASLVLALEALDEFSEIARSHPPLQKRGALFFQGKPFTSLFIVRSGSVKQVTQSDGHPGQITGFFLPGELVGLDGIAEQRYPGTALAMETTTACELPFARLDALSGQRPELRGALYRCLSQAMLNERQMMRQLLCETADVRLASFLASMSARFRRRGYSPYCFRLAMARGDIGNYLGLAVETVSRCLSRFQRNEIVATRGREFRILDLGALTMLASGTVQPS